MAWVRKDSWRSRRSATRSEASVARRRTTGAALPVKSTYASTRGEGPASCVTARTSPARSRCISTGVSQCDEGAASGWAARRLPSVRKASALVAMPASSAAATARRGASASPAATAAISLGRAWAVAMRAPESVCARRRVCARRPTAVACRSRAPTPRSAATT
ncbi:MAG: hypothetical protein DMF77_00125 [Acidobacteria bacterium]|nr:MAG: hypothetical protein DMF77_00125 [Acidobacteriota bacterium]